MSEAAHAGRFFHPSAPLAPGFPPWYDGYMNTFFLDTASSLSHGGEMVLALSLTGDKSIAVTKTGRRYGALRKRDLTDAVCALAKKILRNNETGIHCVHGTDFLFVGVRSDEAGAIIRHIGTACILHHHAAFAVSSNGAWSFLDDGKFLAMEGAPKENELVRHLAANEEGFFGDALFRITGRKERIVIVGDHPVSRSLSDLASQLGFAVTIVSRQSQRFLKSVYSKQVTCKSGQDLASAITAFPPDPFNCWVFAENPFNDAEWQRWLDHRKTAYVGILFPVSSPSVLPCSVRSPAGLAFGEEGEKAFALSVMTEILMATNHANGNHRSPLASLVIVRGAGDLASGVIIRLVNAGYPVLALEVEKPTVIRRTVSFAEAMFAQSATIEGITARRVSSLEEAKETILRHEVPILPDPEGHAIRVLEPPIVVDAILAKRNLGTKITDAPLVIALGPGFSAGTDCHYVIETMRGHSLGKIIPLGKAIPNTGVPGLVGGAAAERVIHSPAAGVFHAAEGIEIGRIVAKGEIIAMVGECPVAATLNGMLRGLLHDDLFVPKGFKIADIDPRGKKADFHTASDKAKAIAGSVLEVIDRRYRW